MLSHTFRIIFVSAGFGKPVLEFRRRFDPKGFALDVVLTQYTLCSVIIFNADNFLLSDAASLGKVRHGQLSCNNSEIECVKHKF